MNLAIVIGVEKYKSSNFGDLPACLNDARLMRDVLNNVKDLKDLLYINESESGYEAKNKISEFIEKYKTFDIKEIFFYFSGHGERYDDDFFYLFSDFDGAKRETTGLRNTELDGWFKSLSPELCVKVVDACFSGTQYIKSESSTESDIAKSAKKNELKDIYFWFSSRENDYSYAGDEFSRFSESIFTALTEYEGDVRYRDIMAYVADDFVAKGKVRPIFITQADNVEKFGVVTKDTHNLILKSFGLVSDENNQEDNSHSEKKRKEENSLVNMITIRASEICFNEEQLYEYMGSFKGVVLSWDEDINSLYSVVPGDRNHENHVPNRKRIGEWLKENIKEEFFANPTYERNSYNVEEYKALPKKPKNNVVSLLYGGVFRDEGDCKLNCVTAI